MYHPPRPTHCLKAGRGVVSPWAAAMTLDSDDKGKHLANIINVEDYLSKRMNKFAGAEPPPGYPTACLMQTHHPNGLV